MNLEPIKNQIKTVLSDLGPLLNRDPDDEFSPAIFAANANTAPPVYPCLTYHMTATPDNRMTPTRAEGGGQSKAYTITLSLEAWSAKNGTVAEQLATATENALSGKYFDFPGGTIHEVQTLTNEQARFDPKFKAYFSLLLLRLRVYIP